MQTTGDPRQQYGLVIDGRPVIEDAPKVNWNHLHCTFRPRSGRLPQHQPQPDDAADVAGWAVGFGVAEGRPPSALATRPKSAGFPARFHRRARRTPGASAAAANAGAEDSDDELADMWRLDDEDNVELDDIFDQLTRRGASGSQQQQQQLRRKKAKKQQQQQSQPGRPWRARTPAKKSATQLYQEHLLAEIAKHRLKATAHQRPPPPELSLFIPKTRTRLCRLYTGSCLLRSGSNPAAPVSSLHAASAATAASVGGFVPIARPLLPLPAELRQLSRQQAGAGSGSARGGSAQVSGSTCNCCGGGRSAGRPSTAVASGRGGGRMVASYSDNCTVCQRLRLLQLA